jgi:hypothetical protein
MCSVGIGGVCTGSESLCRFLIFDAIHFAAGVVDIKDQGGSESSWLMIKAC